MSYSVQLKEGYESNKMYSEDEAIHSWYRFVLSYPPHLVRECLNKFGATSSDLILDPFCGTGTTLVECKKNGIPSVGLEANPIAHFAASTKIQWNVDTNKLRKHAEHVYNICQSAEDALDNRSTIFDQPSNGLVTTLRTLSDDQKALLIKDSISPIPLHKFLTLKDTINQNHDENIKPYELLALAKHLVFSYSNLRFGPEVGIGKLKKNATVTPIWLNAIKKMIDDIELFRDKDSVRANVILNDARQVSTNLKLKSVSGIITSPPYPNEKDYTRATRLESVLLDFIRTKADLRKLKDGLIRSNTRNVYASDEDYKWVENIKNVQEIAQAIETRRLTLGKTSGFEKLYGKVVQLYFGGMARHLEQLKPYLKNGAQLAYVVGDQASYFRILIKTGKLLSEVAESLGYKVTNIELFRTRISTATKISMDEEIVYLSWSTSSQLFKKISQENGILNNKLVEPNLKIVEPQLNPKVVKTSNRYDKLIETIFFAHYLPGLTVVRFNREEFTETANKLGIPVPKNLGDVVYSYKFRTSLPASIIENAPVGTEWVIVNCGQSNYEFQARVQARIVPDSMLIKIKIPDATPGIVKMHTLNDEQALLTRLRYNRILDIFTGIITYSLQNHLRTSIPGYGQIETDEIYIGVDKKGAQYVLPVQAKGGKDEIGVVQIEQDIAMCKHKFPKLICKAIATQFLSGGIIAIMEFALDSENNVRKVSEQHYSLVDPSELTDEDIARYKASVL